MPETPKGLLTRLAALGIEARTTTHPPVFTVAESQALRGTLPGGGAGTARTLFVPQGGKCKLEA